MFEWLNGAGKSEWMGFRPSMPDSVPVISGSTRHRNAFFGFGHGHIGLTLGAVTGGILADLVAGRDRSEEHTSELQSLMRISYAVFCLKTQKKTTQISDS